jgi:hypothetical protein
MQAALYANQIYLADRGPDITSQSIIYDTIQYDMTTVYWAVVTPSFCVNGPCAPWFGTDWGEWRYTCSVPSNRVAGVVRLPGMQLVAVA